MPTPHQPAQTHANTHNTEDFADSLKLPSRQQQEAAFLRSGTGTEILPGRFVMDPTASLWCILHSEITDPSFASAIIALSDSQASADQKTELMNAIITGHVDAFNKKVAAGAVPALPTALYPGTAIDYSPLLFGQVHGATDAVHADFASALRHVVRDGHVIIPKTSQWTPYDVVTAEFIAAAVSDVNMHREMNLAYDIMAGLLTAFGPMGADAITLITPNMGVAIRGPLFWAKTQLGLRERGLPNLYRTLVERLDPIFDEQFASEHTAAFRRGSELAAAALDAALIPAKNTVDALRAFERETGEISERKTAA